MVSHLIEQMYGFSLSVGQVGGPQAAYEFTEETLEIELGATLMRNQINFFFLLQARQHLTWTRWAAPAYSMVQQGKATDSQTKLTCSVLSEREQKESRADEYRPCMRKVLSSWSVATGLISVRRFTYLPTTRGALLKPRILQQKWGNKETVMLCLIKSSVMMLRTDDEAPIPVQVKSSHLCIMSVIACIRLPFNNVVSAISERWSAH